MKIFLLEGKFTHYICIADDLLEVEKQLRDRYKWAKDLKITINTKQVYFANKKVIFNISWKEFSNYEYKPVSTTFTLLLEEVLPTNSVLIPEFKDNYH